MEHFCNNFVPPKGNFITEQLVLYDLGSDRWVQGYIDLIKQNSDGTLSIYDWKTSTNFTKTDLVHHGRQLVFYALAKESEGYKVKEVAWIMLKYAEVKFMGKKRANSKEKTEITKVVNRGKLISELKNYLEADLDELGFDEIDIEFLIKEALETNSLNKMPDAIKNAYTIKPYVRKYEITDELKAETINYLNEMADRFEQLDPNDKTVWLPREFTKKSKDGKEKPDTFFVKTSVISAKNVFT